jgi:hypothetical protein
VVADCSRLDRGPLAPPVRLVLAFALALPIGAGCTPGGYAGMAYDVDAGPGAGGGEGGPGGPTGSSIACNATAGGCLCLLDDPQPGTLGACSPATIVRDAQEQAVCCLNEFLCSCNRYGCRSDDAASYCQCGLVTDLAGVTIGVPVAACPPPTPQQRCCLSSSNATCICSRLACAAEEVEVPSCAAATAGTCVEGEAIAACR